MNIIPLQDRILIKTNKETTTKGGIIIPDTAQNEKPTEGEVIAVGSGARDQSGKLIPLDVKVGDTILFAKWGGNEIKVEGEDYLIIKESDVLAIIKRK